MKYMVELIWNREFHWSHYSNGDSDDLEISKSKAISIRDSGDGCRVKKIRIIDTETGNVIWNG